MEPLVSVCIPNLNTHGYLRERFESVFRQTFQDWELFVYDSYSDDGSWELIQELASTDKRVRIAQGPRQGPYPAWNVCLAETAGKYVYIATSDDSMSPDFLEKMVSGLERHPECELAHCPLVVVDHDGKQAADHSWPECTIFGDCIGDMVRVPHVRHAPYDGLLQLTGRHTVLSITQLLIRRSLFTKTGGFTNRWGSVSDFNWEMRAGLTTNTLHVPDTWATWRVRPNQASASLSAHSMEYFEKLEEMIQDAIRECSDYLPNPVQAGLIPQLERTKELRMYYAVLRGLRHSTFRRRLFQFRQLLQGSGVVRKEILAKTFGNPNWSDSAPIEIRKWLEAVGLQSLTLAGLPSESKVGSGVPAN